MSSTSFIAFTEQLLRRRPLAGLAAALLLVAAILAVSACIQALRSRDGARLRRVVAASAASLLGGLVASGWVVAAARNQLVHHEEPELEANPIYASIRAAEQAEAMLFVAGLGLLICASLLGASFALRARVAREADPWRAALLGTIVSLAVVTGLGLVARSIAVRPWIQAEDAPFVTSIDALQAAGAASLATARACILALAALGSAVAVAASLRRRGAPAPAPPAASRAQIAAAALLFGLGLAAYVATRSRAADARSPLPSPSRKRFDCSTLELRPRDLQIARCGPAGDGPKIDVSTHGVRIDGFPTPDPAELQARLAAIRAERLSPAAGGRLSPPLIAVEAGHRAADIGPYLRASMVAHGPEIGIAAQEPPAMMTTSTLGEIELSARCCEIAARLDPRGAPLSGFATWGDLVRAAAESPTPLLIAP